MKKLLLVVASLAFAAPAFAAQTTGATHLLTRGPGAEGAALGSSVLAITQDPTALYWNPAGLARAGGAITGEHIFLYEGARYDFIGLSVPSRLGTFGLGALQLYRGGIVARQAIDDPGNKVSSSQSDYIAGYARDIGERLALGAAVNVLDFNLAGYKDKGVGGDIGAQATLPADDFWRLRQGLWSFGLVVKNLVEPKLKLREEEESYPREFRAGAGFSFDALSRTSLDSGSTKHDRATLTAAFRKTGGDPGLHPSLGLSYSLQGLLVLRLGYDGEVSGGLGLQTLDGKFAVDYALEDRALSQNHRFTLSYRYAAPKAPASTQARQETDEEYVRAYARAQALSDEFYTKGQEFFKNLQYADAVESLEAAAVLDPENREKIAFLTRSMEVERREAVRTLEERMNAQLTAGQEAQAYRTIARLLDYEAPSEDISRIIRRLPERMSPADLEAASKAVFEERSAEVSGLLASGHAAEALRRAEESALFESTYTAVAIARLKEDATAHGAELKARLEGELGAAQSAGARLAVLAALQRAYPDDTQLVARLDSARREYSAGISLSGKERLYLRKLYCLAAVRYAKKDFEGARDLIEEVLRRDAADSRACALKETLLRARSARR